MLMTEEHEEQTAHEVEATTTVSEQDPEPLVDPSVDTFQLELIAVDDIYVIGDRPSESLGGCPKKNPQAL